MLLREGCAALVTGGNTGIGAAVALALAKHGANVAITYRKGVEGAQQVVSAIEQIGCKALALQVDVTQRAAVRAAVDQAAQTLGGRIDVLVNNAGDLIRRQKLEDMEEDFWDAVIDVNLKSVFLVTQAALPYLQNGRIINMSSLAGFDGGGPGAAVYATAKAGIIALTRGMAKEFAPRGITVNAVAPGFIANTGFHNTFTAPEAQQGMIARTPLGRGGTPDDVAGAVLYLASEYASFITGEVIQVNGGLAFQ